MLRKLQDVERKGIILAGGAGTRLYPITKGVSKQLVPVYDKPMVYYPLTTLMLSGIKEILLISTPQDISRFSELLGDGSQWGINLQYATQDSPDGLPQAFLIAKKFLNGQSVALILGDNIFYGHDLASRLSLASQSKESTIFAYQVSDPERYGVIEFDCDYSPISIEEKPNFPKSNYAITGLYFFNNDVVDVAGNLKPSPRGELEIVDLIKHYLKLGSLHVEIMGRGDAWLDTGTCDALLEASTFIATLQKRQGLMVACPEEIAYRLGWITGDEVLQLAQCLKKSNYGNYLEKIIYDKFA